MNDSREIFALVNFIEITRECRRQLVADVLSGNPDLFRFLYEDKKMFSSSTRNATNSSGWRRIG